MNYPSEEPETKIRERTCLRCQKPYQQKGVAMSRFGKTFWMGTLCQDCGKLEEEEKIAEEEKERQEQHEALWAQTVPWIYRENDPDKLGAKVVKVIDKFDFQDSKGLYLSGSFGIGKTRAMSIVLRRCFDDGKTVLFLNAVELGKLFAEKFHSEKGRREKAEHTVYRAATVRVLLIDDLGKERATERFETELYSLLEDRCSSGKPMLITSNYRVTELAERFSQDQGGAIIRRISEFCHAYNL
jgi:DNA replication protein DnaC